MTTVKSQSAINDFLKSNGIFINDNPAISPDLVLDEKHLEAEVSNSADAINKAIQVEGNELNVTTGSVIFYPRSWVQGNDVRLFLVETTERGDAGLVTADDGDLPFEDMVSAGGLRLIPLTMANVISLKNFLLESDSSNTLFPKADGNLVKSSLGIGARFTSLHWPAVAWAMSNLGLSLTANQNSIPRELVYDVDAMLEDKLQEIPFPFIGGTVPEGHQGQSVQGMSHTSVLTFMKYGFHHHGIVHGFNADHQPIGGRFDLIEDELVGGSLFASYITYDLSPELTETPLLSDPAEIEAAFEAQVDKDVAAKVSARLAELDLAMDKLELKKLLTYLTPGMKKMKLRDKKYTDIRVKNFTTKAGQAFYKELSIDELPGEETRPETLAACLVMAEAMGIEFQYVAPNLGFQKNMPYPDNAELRQKIDKLFDVAKKLNVSFGFHSGSGKSGENYQVMGEATGQALEIKTSGRYTYEMGVALSESENEYDQKLWKDWYAFTIELSVEGAFSENQSQKDFAREFIETSFETAKVELGNAFDDADTLRAALKGLAPSPEYMFWFEYNFLYVLAAEGKTDRLGDHTPTGYQQRKRFYAISDEGKLRFSKKIAEYIIFLARNTGLSSAEKCDAATATLNGCNDLQTLLSGIGAK